MMGRLWILAFLLMTGCGRMAGEIVVRAVGEAAISAVSRAATPAEQPVQMAPVYVDPTPQMIETGRQAARRGDCAQVAHTGATLYQMNRMVHDTVYLADPAVAWCVVEMRRRSAIAYDQQAVAAARSGQCRTAMALD